MDDTGAPDPALEDVLRHWFDNDDDAAEIERLLRMFDARDEDNPVLAVGEVVDHELVGVRSAGTLEDDQLLVRGGWVDLVLDIAGAGLDLVDVRGSVLGDAGVCAVQLLHDGAEVAIATTDALGEFVLRSIPRGRYELVVAGDGAELSTMVELD